MLSLSCLFRDCLPFVCQLNWKFSLTLPTELRMIREINVRNLALGLSVSRWLRCGGTTFGSKLWRRSTGPVPVSNSKVGDSVLCR